MRSQGTVYSGCGCGCGCRDGKTGRRLGCRCPRRGDPGHGSWYVCVELRPCGVLGGFVPGGAGSWSKLKIFTLAWRHA